MSFYSMSAWQSGQAAVGVSVHIRLAKPLLASAGFLFASSALSRGGARGHMFTAVIQLPRMNCDGLWEVVWLGGQALHMTLVN